MLYALIDREDREVTGSPKAPVVEEGLEAAQDPGRAVAEREYPLHEIRAGQVKLGAGDGLAGVLEQAGGVLPQDLPEPAGLRQTAAGADSRALRPAPPLPPGAPADPTPSHARRKCGDGGPAGGQRAQPGQRATARGPAREAAALGDRFSQRTRG